MKYSSFHRISLTTLSLMAALAVNVRANGPLTSSLQHHRSALPNHAMFPKLLPAALYQIDDGTAEEGVGLTIGGDLICLNEFTVVPGSATITSISIAWGSPSFPDPSLNGLPYTAVLWSDPNGDGSPTDAVVLATAPGVISAPDTDTFLVTNIGPRTVPTTNFFVGFIVNHVAGQFPASFDETDPTLANRSFVAYGETPDPGDIYNLSNNDGPVAPIESYGLVGNWLIRANGTSSSLQLEAAASEITQGTAGTFDIDLPLTGRPGIECRAGIPQNLPGSYKWVFNFSQPIVSVDSTEVDCGRIQNLVIEPGNPYQVSLYTTNSGCTASYVTATLSGVHSSTETLASASATMGLLVGDVDGNGVVDDSDFHQVKRLEGQTVSHFNFREDVTASGKITRHDTRVVRSHAGEILPPP